MVTKYNILLYIVFRECTQFAPVAKHSMRYCFANSKHGTSPISQLTLFGAALGKCG